MLHTNLQGIHQHINATLAIAALDALAENQFIIEEDSVKKGLQDVSWPGRLELIDNHISLRYLKGLIPNIKGRILLDCAHNPAGMEVLKNYLSDEIDV